MIKIHGLYHLQRPLQVSRCFRFMTKLYRLENQGNVAHYSCSENIHSDNHKPAPTNKAHNGNWAWMLPKVIWCPDTCTYMHACPLVLSHILFLPHYLCSIAGRQSQGWSEKKKEAGDYSAMVAHPELWQISLGSWRGTIASCKSLKKRNMFCGEDTEVCSSRTTWVLV